MKIDLNKFYYHERFGLLTPVSGYIHCDWSKEFGTPQGQVVSYDDDETMTCSDYPIGSIVYIVPWRYTAKVIHHHTSENNIIVAILDSEICNGRYNFNVQYITKQNESRNRKDFTIGKKIYIPTANYHSKILESFGFLQTLKGLVLTVTKDNYHEFLEDHEVLKNENLSDLDFQVGTVVKFKNKKATIIESNFKNLRNHCVIKLNNKNILYVVHYLNLKFLKK